MLSLENTTCAIMFSVETNFGEWIDGELLKRQWSRSELSRRASLSRGTLSNIASGKRGVGKATCRAIARAFGLPIETVFRAAGLLPQLPPQMEQDEQVLHLFSQLPPKEQERFLAMLQAAVDPPTPHDFRRAFAINALRAGMDVYSLQRLMGHADLQIMRRYLDQVTDDLHRAHTKYSPVDKML